MFVSEMLFLVVAVKSTFRSSAKALVIKDNIYDDSIYPIGRVVLKL